MRRPSFASIVLAVAWAVAVAVLGDVFADIGPWYEGLNLPSWQPPEWSFGPIWSTMYLLCTVAAVVAANALAADRVSQRSLVLAYATNGVLNVLWAFLFFRRQAPGLALADLLLLFLSVVWMIGAASRTSRFAAWLLVPYLVWVMFVAALNWAIVRTN